MDNINIRNLIYLLPNTYNNNKRQTRYVQPFNHPNENKFSESHFLLRLTQPRISRSNVSSKQKERERETSKKTDRHEYSLNVVARRQVRRFLREFSPQLLNENNFCSLISVIRFTHERSPRTEYGKECISWIISFPLQRL